MATLSRRGILNSLSPAGVQRSFDSAPICNSYKLTQRVRTSRTSGSNKMTATVVKSGPVGLAAQLQAEEPCHREPGFLTIDGSRLMNAIHGTCEFGKAHRYGEHPTETGMARLSLDDDDKKVRRWLIEQAESIGCKVTIDQMGNIFAVRPGKKNDAPPVMMGSHLDTQPTGGRYDGILGVISALEVLRTFHDKDFQTQGPVGLINWTNEEGARFPMITVASGVWAGAVPLDTAWECKDTEHKTMKQELERIGFLGDVRASYEAQPIAAHFELHIEQGPILEDEGQKIGIVTGAQAYRWYEVEVKGRDSHAGTTPFAARRDALLAAAKMVVESNRIAKDFAGLVTTGVIHAEPGSTNTMPHTVRFTLDIRHPDDSELAEMVTQCQKSFARIAKEDSERGVAVGWKCLAENTAAKFDPACIELVEQSAREVSKHLVQAQSPPKDLWRRMVSGAGHDSCHVSRRCPTAMIFTPTRNGMSHTPDEYCSPEDCIIGAQVLLGAVVRYDAARRF